MSNAMISTNVWIFAGFFLADLSRHKWADDCLIRFPEQT